MRILFMGSPELAVPSFQAVMNIGQVVGVITQPPRSSGRGQKLTPSAISIEALRSGIVAMTPGTLKTPEITRTLRELEPDIAVVVAYGKILPPDILAVPELGCVNVHASILPELRGAAPIQWAIARGYKETGVTLMQMDEGMDTGPILIQRTTPIGPLETARELGIRLGQMGAELLREGLPLFAEGKLQPIEQDGSLATYAPLLKKSDGLIDWSLDSQEIADRVRGFSPWPGTFTTRGGKRILVTGSAAMEEPSETPPGTITSAGSDGIHVSCGSGTLNILAVKPEGKREMTVGEFLAGYTIEVGEILGT
jgi:methionyl-tRNA formyltransferase